jgi:hypothetical protein
LLKTIGVWFLRDDTYKAQVSGGRNGLRVVKRGIMTTVRDMFCLYDNCQAYREGYAVTAEYKWGEDYEWVCASCFEALKDNLG